MKSLLNSWLKNTSYINEIIESIPENEDVDKSATSDEWISLVRRKQNILLFERGDVYKRHLFLTCLKAIAIFEIMSIIKLSRTKRSW